VTPSYNSNTYGVTLAGSPYIPGLFKPSTKQFVFMNFTGMKSSKQSVFNAMVPTDNQRNGDFATSEGNNPIYNPFTGTQLVTTQATPLPVCSGTPTGGCITPQAKYLLQFFPEPNTTATATSNYQRVATPASDSNTIAMRYVRNFGQAGGMGFGHHSMQQSGGSQVLRQNLNGNFNYQHAANDVYTAFPQLGGKGATNSLAFGAGYTIGKGRLTNNLSVSWNRSRSTMSNYFTNGAFNPANSNTCPGVNPCFQLGSMGTQNNPLDYGVPGVSFAQFSGLSDTKPSNNVNQVISFSENSSYSKHKHNAHFGFDVRRVHMDTLAGTNVLGSYTFTGYATTCPQASGNCAVGAATGSDFADFLLGLPQQSAIQASNLKYYLRGNIWDIYAQDDFRVRPGLTLNYGMRYEYYSPYSEKYDRLANLALSFATAGEPGLTGVTPVTPNETVGGVKYPHTLVYPNRNDFSPRIGFAWKIPKALGKSGVMRGGYGVNYNTSQYGTFANRLASEPPYANTQTNLAGNNGCGTYLSWAVTAPTGNISPAFACGVSGTVSQTISNTYAVNPRYRMGYVQIWNLGVQRTLPLKMVLNVDYTGSKGTHLDMVRAPNRGLNGTLVANADPFNYEDSDAGSHLDALAVNLRKRLTRGVALGATYTYAHSIDNASSIGGNATVVAQNDLNLHAEEGNSSFDVRQKVSGNWLFELPFGPNTPLLNSGKLISRMAQGWSFSGSYTFATGTPLTPHYGNSSAEVARGSNGTYRPDRVPGVSAKAGGGNYLHWINNYAFFNAQGAESNTGQCNETGTAGAVVYPANCPYTTPLPSTPANPSFGYGNASRNSIEGPGTVSINGAISKTVQLGTTRSFEMRAQASNMFNTVQYAGVDTNLNSHTFGQVTSVSSGRQITVMARYRF
jgi:hypothetical protein